MYVKYCAYIHIHVYACIYTYIYIYIYIYNVYIRRYQVDVLLDSPNCLSDGTSLIVDAHVDAQLMRLVHKHIHV